MKPLVVTRGTSSKLAFCLYLQRMKKIFCDIKLNIGNTVSINLHSCVLASFSPCLDSLVSSVKNGEIDKDSAKNSSVLNWSFQRPLELTLTPEKTDSSTENQECEDCALKFFDFLYLGKLRIDKDHISHVEYLSKILQIHELLVECENYRKLSETDEKMIYEEEPCTTVSSASEHKVEDIVNYVESVEHINAMNGEIPPHEIHDQIEQKPSSPMDDFISIKPTSVEENDITPQAITTVHQCNSCNYFTKSHYDLLTHMLLSNHKKKVCSLCMFEADCSNSLTVHVLLHNDPKPFFCSFCNARFETKRCLKIHSSDKHPYSCLSCNMLFQSDNELNNHMAGHKSEKYMCTKCGFCTADNSELKSHILLGSDVFECTESGCSYSTHFKCTFGEHMVKHNNQTSFLCEVCGESFLKQEDLVHHTHSNSATHFSCPMCHFQTANIDKLENHLARSHPKYRCKIVKVKNAPPSKKPSAPPWKNLDNQASSESLICSPSTSPHQDESSCTDILNLKDKSLANAFVLPISASRSNKTSNKTGMEEKVESSDENVKLENVITSKTVQCTQQNSEIEPNAKIKEEWSPNSNLAKNYVTNQGKVEEGTFATSTGDKKCRKDAEKLPPPKKKKLELDDKCKAATYRPIYILPH